MAAAVPVFDLIPQDVLREVLFRKHLTRDDRLVARCACRRFRAVAAATTLIYHVGRAVALYAAEHGYVALLDWLREQSRRAPIRSAWLREELWKKAAWYGHVSVFGWLDAADVDCDNRIQIAKTITTLNHGNALEWIMRHWPDEMVATPHFDLLIGAAEAGAVRTLGCLVRHYPKYACAYHRTVMETAVYRDHDEVLRWWVCDSGMCPPLSEFVVIAAERLRRLLGSAIFYASRRSLVFLLLLGARLEDAQLDKIASTRGDADFVLWLHERGLPWRKELTAALAARGRTTLLRAVVGAGCPLAEQCCEMLFGCGDFKTYAADCPETVEGFFERIVDTMHWLRARGLQWSDSTERGVRARENWLRERMLRFSH